MPEVLDGELRVRGALRAVSLRLQERLTPLSRAVLTIVPGPCACEPGDLVRLYTVNGPAGIYRAEQTELREDGLMTVRLLHGLCTLSDTVLFGEHGFTGAGSTLSGIVQALLNTQPYPPRWAIGTIAADGHADCTLRHVNVLKALLSLPEIADAPMEWRFDQSAVPWQVSLCASETAVRCVLAPGRNLTGFTLTRSRTGMATRLYPVGADNLTVEGVNGGLPYVRDEEAEADGVIARIWQDTAQRHPEALLQTARNRLLHMGRETLQAECDAVDRWHETGDPLDRIAPGRLCRLQTGPGESTELTITEVIHRDVYGAPGVVKAVLAGGGERMTAMMNRADCGGGKVL